MLLLTNILTVDSFSDTIVTMEDIEKRLQALGLEEKEAKIYLSCLHLGKDTVFHIAEHSGIKRTTVYFILKSLAERGLIATEKTKKAVLFSPAHPRRLLIHVEHQKKILDDLLPELSALYNVEPDKPNIQVFEGEAGLTRVYEEITSFLQEKKEVMFFGGVSHLAAYPDLLKVWKRETKNKTFRIRELINNDTFHEGYAKELGKNKNPNHEVRFLPKTAERFCNDNAIFGNKLVIFSTQKTMFATVVESDHIVNSYRVMFELAWEQTGKDIERKNPL